MAEQSTQVIIIDNGSGFCKVGFSGENTPKVCIPTIIGRHKHESAITEAKEKDVCIGEEAQAQKDSLKLIYPIEHGTITSWKEIEEIWHYFYTDMLKVNPEEHPVLLTEATMGPKINRENITQIFFETFNVPSLFVQIPAMLSLYATGRITGVVLESGDGLTDSVPIFEGFTLPHAVTRSYFAGRELTDYMLELLKTTEVIPSPKIFDREIAQNIKEKLSYVALDFESELITPNSEKEVNYTLPDGQIISIHDQRFRCPEALFQAQNQSKSHPAIHKLIQESIMKSHIDIRNELFSNVVLSGGSTMFNGIENRLRKELIAIAPEMYNIEVIAPAERRFLAWIGGSILSKTSTFQTMCITKGEFSENGPSIVHRKCFF